MNTFLPLSSRSHKTRASFSLFALTVGSILGGRGICTEYLVRSTPTRMPSSTSVGDTLVAPAAGGTAEGRQHVPRRPGNRGRRLNETGLSTGNIQTYMCSRDARARRRHQSERHTTREKGWRVTRGHRNRGRDAQTAGETADSLQLPFGMEGLFFLGVNRWHRNDQRPSPFALRGMKKTHTRQRCLHASPYRPEGHKARDWDWIHSTPYTPDHAKNPQKPATIEHIRKPKKAQLIHVLIAAALLTHLFSEAYDKLGDLPDVDDVLGVFLAGVDDLRAPRHLGESKDEQAKGQVTGKTSARGRRLSRSVDKNFPPAGVPACLPACMAALLPGKQGAGLHCLPVGAAPPASSACPTPGPIGWAATNPCPIP